MTTFDIDRDRCPGCGSNNMYAGGIGLHSAVKGRVWLRLAHRLTQKSFDAEALVCLDCGRFQQRLLLTDKDKKEIAEGFTRLSPPHDQQ